MSQNPKRWDELTHDQKERVEQYIATLLAQQIAMFQTKNDVEGSVTDIKTGICYQLEKVKCGKDCEGCPHGPYWYAYYRGSSGKVVSKYIGKELKQLDNSCVTEADKHLDSYIRTWGKNGD